MNALAESNVALRMEVNALRDKVRKLESDNHRLLDEVYRLAGEVIALERAETERLGTFPAPPRGESIWIIHPCGCTPHRECDKHDLQADDAFKRSQDV